MLIRLLFSAASIGLAAAPPDQALRILEKNCFGCHGAAVALSGLRLDSRSATLQGGKRGPAIVPGQSAASPIIKAVNHADPKLAMPPGGKLSDADIAVLREWVDTGATWPAASANAAASKWWSFQKPISNGNASIDSFNTAKLREKTLTAGAEADRRTLIRRANFDLTGLAPTESEISAFVNNASPAAYNDLIDRLLASPTYGEKWGKHWLDLVRYGDTSGFEQDPYNLYAWRYRD